MNDYQTRRAALRLIALAAGAAGLAACSSSPSRRDGAGTVGDPLPGDDPLLNSPTRNNRDFARNDPSDALEDWRSRRAGPAPGPRPTAPSGIVPRSAWAKDRPVPTLADPLRRITRITIHHEGSTVYTSTRMDDTLRRLESIRQAHRQLGWADIGYHYAIDPAGRVYEGRSLQLQGAHVKNNNEENLGVVLLGNFEQQAPTPQALSALERFVAQQMARYRVGVSRVYTHRELRPTLCPGRNLQGKVLSMRSGGSLGRVFA